MNDISLNGSMIMPNSIDTLINQMQQKLQAYEQKGDWAYIYKYLYSREMYDDFRKWHVDSNNVDIDLDLWQDLVLDHFVNTFRFADSKCYQYFKDICKQLGLEESTNPFITFFKNMSKYKFETKDIIALNNAYVNGYINTNKLAYNKPDSKGIDNIIYKDSLYRNNKSTRDILDLLKASAEFRIQDSEDKNHYDNIFYDENGQVRSWDLIKQDLTDYQLRGDYAKQADTDLSETDRLARRLSRVSNKTKTEVLSKMLDNMSDDAAKELAATLFNRTRGLK